MADGVWTKVVFNEVSSDTLEGFDPDTGGYTLGCTGKFHFAAGVRFLRPDVPNRYVNFLLYKNGEPRDKLTPECGRGFSRGEVIGSLGDVFEIYVRRDFGERADLTLRHPDPADEHTATDRHPVYFMGLWHA